MKRAPNGADAVSENEGDNDGLARPLPPVVPALPNARDDSHTWCRVGRADDTVASAGKLCPIGRHRRSWSRSYARPAECFCCGEGREPSMVTALLSRGDQGLPDLHRLADASGPAHPISTAVATSTTIRVRRQSPDTVEIPVGKSGHVAGILRGWAMPAPSAAIGQIGRAHV